MKKTYLLLFLLSFTVSAFSFSLEIFDDISASIRTGDVRALSRNFNSSIDLTVGLQDGTYSKAQAEQVLREFFTTNKPATFTLIHQGLSKEGARYAIGSLTTSQGKTFRVYLYVKQVDGNFIINELRFMPE